MVDEMVVDGRWDGKRWDGGKWDDDRWGGFFYFSFLFFLDDFWKIITCW